MFLIRIIFTQLYICLHRQGNRYFFIGLHFRVDLTAPEEGTLRVGGSVSSGVQYTTSFKELIVFMVGFEDQESGIQESTLQLYQEPSCEYESPPDNWTALSDEINVKDTVMYTFRQLLMQPNIPYRVQMRVANGAGLSINVVSKAIFLDFTPPLKGAFHS